MSTLLLLKLGSAAVFKALLLSALLILALMLVPAGVGVLIRDWRQAKSRPGIVGSNSIALQ